MENKNYLKNFFLHLHTVNTHRFLVMMMCFRCGMIRQGLLHDLSKYSPIEFIPSVKYFQGNRSPISYEKDLFGYSPCWLHHKGRNKHHWEYWVDRTASGIEIISLKMPYRYMLESVIDRISASKVYGKKNYTQSSPYDFFVKSKEYSVINETTRKQIEENLYYLKQHGEKQALRHYRQLYKEHKNDR